MGCAENGSVGQLFAYAAALLYALAMAISLLAQGFKGSVDTPLMDAANAAGQSVDRVAGNFGAEAGGQGSDLFLHKDNSNVAMIKEIFLVQSAEGWWEILDGMLVGGADLLIIVALLSLKTQMALKKTASTGRRRRTGPRSSDESELIMMTSFVLGMTLPMVDFLFSVGPRYKVGEIARIALIEDTDLSEENVWNNFGDEQWRSMYLSYTLTESLFQWTNVMAQLLQGAGFIVLAQIGERAGPIWDNRLGWASRLAGGAKLLAFVCGVLQGLNNTFELGYVVADVCGRVCIPIFLVMLGQGLGKVDDLSKQQGLEGLQISGRKSRSPEDSAAAAAAEGWAEGLPM